MQERHDREQYFFDEATLATLAELLEPYRRPCLVCCPRLGERLHAGGRPAAVLDVDERFAHLPGFVRWDLHAPRPLAEPCDAIVCDPPFFGVPLRTLDRSLKLLAGYDVRTPLAVGYLRRRRRVLLRAFASWGLVETPLRLTYATVEDCDRNDIRLYANFPVGG